MAVMHHVGTVGTISTSDIATVPSTGMSETQKEV